MNAAHSRLLCERCHGIGYVSTALGKLPCLACSAAEVSSGQELSEVVSNHQDMSITGSVSAGPQHIGSQG
jgi:hypothetical protein